jgi:ketosteroid isomerase-like protein
MADNVATVLAIYEAFGTGDVPTILEKLDEDVEWEKGQRDTTVPWLQRRHGRDGAAAFFQAVAEEVDIEAFDLAGEPMASESMVAVPTRFKARVKANGAVVGGDLQVHLWWFGDDGLVTGFRHVHDLTADEVAFAAGG